MKVTMVKKLLASGDFCKKCRQIEKLLKERGFWERIDDVVTAAEDDPDSPGMRLASEYGVTVAPFFIVREEGDAGPGRIYTSALQLIRDARDWTAPAALFDTLSGKSPAEIVEHALSAFGRDCGIAFSGAEDVVLVDMAARTGLPFSVFSLDTGRLHPETYRFIEAVREKYGVEINMMVPDYTRLERFVREKGLYSFYTDGHSECCGIRKVEPLKRALEGLKAWITGQRKDQNPVTRGDVPAVQEDPSFSGAGGGSIVKFNPLSDWSLGRVWEYIREHDVPYNELHDRGYISIGCEPCTRAVLPGEHERAGRWWWEKETKRECGLHIGAMGFSPNR